MFLGRVERIEPSLNAAFVEIGLGRPGMLPLKKQGNPTEGAVIPVQVRRDEREGKAVRLSATIHSEVAYEEQLALAKGRALPALLVPPPSAWQTCLAALDPAGIEEVICERRVDVAAVQRWCALHAPELCRPRAPRARARVAAGARARRTRRSRRRWRRP